MANDLMNRHNDLFGGLDDWFDDDHFFNNLGRMFYGLNGRRTDLKTDIKETDHDYTVAGEIPGLDKKDINVTYDQNVLTISGKKDSFNDLADKKGNTIMSERSYVTFTRQYRLPDVKADQIQGKYENGLLTVTLPKAKTETPSDHRIDIQ